GTGESIHASGCRTRANDGKWRQSPALKSCQFNILNRLTLVGAVIVLSWDTACNRIGTPASVRERPDVIVVTIDTLRADRVGVLGGPANTTPAIDALARSGALFLDATAHAPLTLPSHASILTGLYPPHHGVHDNSGFALADTVPTLAT